jgi:hypothetical protein
LNRHPALAVFLSMVFSENHPRIKSEGKLFPDHALGLRSDGFRGRRRSPA